MSFQYFRVWDRTTRWFHWINVVCIILLAALGTALLCDDALGLTDSAKVLLKTVHVLVGYVFVINLAWRIVWGFIGNRFARWPSIVPFGKGYGSALKTYLKGFFRGEKVPYLGHNPAARLMVVALFAVLIVQAVTGLVLAGTDIYFPPFGHWIAAWVAAPGIDPSTLVPYSKTGIDPTAWDSMRSFRKLFGMTHYWMFFTIVGLVAVHIAGAIVTELREGGGIISAMFTGRKIFDREPVDVAKSEPEPEKVLPIRLKKAS